MIPRSHQSAEASRTRGLAILGSTGSIGRQTLEIVRLFPDAFSVRSLTARNSVGDLARQALEFRPECVVISDESGYAELSRALAGSGIEILTGADHMAHAATLGSVDVVVAAVVGAAGLAPVVSRMAARLSCILVLVAVVIASPILFGLYSE